VPPRQLLSATPPHLEAIVMRCLEKEPSRRFASAAELQRTLAPPSLLPRQRASRWRKLAAISAAVLLAVVVAHKTVKQASSSPQPAVPVQTESASTDFQDQHQVPEELIKLFQAAKQGDAAAQERIGRLYLDGPERARDERKGFFWTRRAALSGDRNAQYTLGQMYENGRGVTHNLIGAYVWYSVAATSGSQSAREALNRVKPGLSTGEMAEAEQQLHRLRGNQER